MAANWYQCWVKHGMLDGKDQVFLMQRCDPILQRFGAVPCAPDGTPIVGQDGTIEVRAYHELGFKMAKSYLEDQGFVIEREQENS